MKHNQSGFSLVSVMVAIGISGILFTALNSHMMNVYKAQVHMKDKGDFESIRLMLESQVSCSQTIQTTCTPGQMMDVVAKNGNTLISKTNGKTFDNKIVRAECGSDGQSVVLRGAKMSNPSITSLNSSDYFKDPLTGAVSTWESPKTLLQPQGVSLCAMKDARDLTCVEGIRQNNKLLQGSTQVFEFIGTTIYDWGLACKKPYVRVGCSMDSLPDYASDRDVRETSYGCTSDNEEWNESAKLHVSCCRLN